MSDNMNEKNKEKIIEKVRRLRAQLEHEATGNQKGITEAEALAFAATMQRLMLQYNLTMSDVEWQTMKVDENISTMRVGFRQGMRTVKMRIGWRETMAKFVCRAHFCKCLVILRTSDLTFVGRPKDLESAATTFVYLACVAERLADTDYAKRYTEAYKAGDVTTVRGYRQSYLYGFAERLGALYALEVKQIEENIGSSTALVRTTDALAAVNQYATETLKVKRVYATARNIVNDLGLADGARSAENIKARGNAKQVTA